MGPGSIPGCVLEKSSLLVNTRDSSMGGDGTICHVSDVNAAAAQLGGEFTREDCGFWATCTHVAEKFNINVEHGNYVEIRYCEIDWTKAGPALVAVIVLIYMIYKQIKRARDNAVTRGVESMSSLGRHRSSSYHH